MKSLCWNIYVYFHWNVTQQTSQTHSTVQKNIRYNICFGRQNPITSLSHLIDMPARNFYQKKPAHLRFGTIDIGTLTGCSRELAQVLKKRNIDIACVQECKWTGSKAAENGEGYKLFYCGERATKNGVAIALSKHLLQSPYKIERTSDWLMSIRIELGTADVNVVTCYAPQTGCSDETKN